MAIVLVLAGAKLERFLLKRQLSVLDSATEGGDVDLTEAPSGHRG